MGKSIQQQVEDIRKKINEVSMKVNQAFEPIIPIDKAVSRLGNYVDTMIEDGELKFDDFVQKGRIHDLGWPDDLRGVLDLIAWINPEEFRNRLIDKLKAFYEQPGLIIDTPELRAAREQQKDDLFKLEVEEERLILVSEAAGTPILRRPDVNPRALVEATP